MAIVTGTIERTNDNYGKFNMAVNGKWYSTKPEWLSVVPNQGDTVEFDDGGRNYIKKLRVVGGGGSTPTATTPASSEQTTELPPHYMIAKGYMNKIQTFPIPADHPDRAITRQNALTNAVNYACSTMDKDSPSTVSEVIEIARMFEAYTTGDLDVEEAKQAMQAMGMEGH